MTCGSLSAARSKLGGDAHTAEPHRAAVGDLGAGAPDGESAGVDVPRPARRDRGEHGGDQLGQGHPSVPVGALSLRYYAACQDGSRPASGIAEELALALLAGLGAAIEACARSACGRAGAPEAV